MDGEVEFVGLVEQGVEPRGQAAGGFRIACPSSRARSTASRTSIFLMSVSMPQSNMTCSRAEPEFAQAEISVTSGMVAISASNSFVLPTHQVNALLMSSGGYRNTDYLRAGGE